MDLRKLETAIFAANMPQPSLSLRDRLNLLNVDELKVELRNFGVTVSGVKNDLVERLAYLIEREKDECIRNPSDGKKSINLMSK